MKYCIFGGSFDPPHAGHLYLAQSALKTLHLDRILWIPAPDPPHKDKPRTPYRHRLAMVRLTVAGRPGHEASDIEERLPSPSYTLRTLEALKSEHGAQHRWHLLIGADNWSIFPTWHRWQDVLAAATVVVFPRRGHALGELPPGVLKLDLPEMHVEATAIRESLAGTGASADLLPEVRAYVRDHGLYTAAAGAA